MSTLFSDDFNRADSDDLGASWTEVPGNASNTAQVLSNRLRLNSNNVDPCLVRTTASAHAAVADGRASVTRITGAGFDGGPVVRFQAATGDYYCLDVWGSNVLEVYRVSANSGLVGSTTSTHAANDVYGLEASGGGASVTLKVYRNGALLTTVIDTDAARITGAGFMGVFSWQSNLDFDNVLAEDLTSGSSASPGGASAVGGPGALAPGASATLGGAAASGQTGTLFAGTPASVSLTGLAAAGAAAPPAAGRAVGLTAASATGQTGALAKAAARALQGQAGGGQAGALTGGAPNLGALAGLSAASGLGAAGRAIAVGLSGLTAAAGIEPLAIRGGWTASPGETDLWLGQTGAADSWTRVGGGAGGWA